MAEFLSIDYEEYENWIAFVVGLTVTANGLHDYCNQTLNLLRRNICREAAAFNLPDCNTNCSRQFRNCFGLWCGTCTAIKDVLQRHYRYKGHSNHINWRNINSCYWKSDTTEIAKVFINKTPDSKNILEDMSSLISLFLNCDKFCIGDKILKDVLSIRNNYYAHFSGLRLTEHQKHINMNILISLIQQKEIADTDSAKWAFEILEKVKNSSHISRETFADETTNTRVALLINDKIMYKENQQLDIEYFRRRMADFEYQERNIRCSNIPVKVFAIALVIGLIGIWFGIFHEEGGRKEGILFGSQSTEPETGLMKTIPSTDYPLVVQPTAFVQSFL